MSHNERPQTKKVHGELTRLWHRSNGSYLPKFALPERPSQQTEGLQIPHVSLTSTIYDTETRLLPIVSQVKKVPNIKYYEHRSTARPLDLMQQAVLSFHDLYGQFPDLLFIASSTMNDFKMEVECKYEEAFTGHYYFARGFKTVKLFNVLTEKELSAFPPVMELAGKKIDRHSVIAVAE